jgi:4-hydroxybenzoate polyprenyltransferase
MLLKPVKFIINSHIFLAIAAASITLATQVQLGFRPQIDAFVAMIFLATIFDYNLHRFLTLTSIPESIHIEKNTWAAGNFTVLKVVIIISFALLVSTLFFLPVNTLFLIAPLAALTLLYSVSYLRNRWDGYRHKKIPGVKTVLLAFIWTASTAFMVFFNRESTFETAGIIFICIERFAFIFAIAIPFDIRDMEVDRKSGINTIPIAFGPEKAMQISNISLGIVLFIGIIQYSEINSLFALTAFLLSIGITLILTNSKKLRLLPYYHNGILDGCVFLHGILVSGSYFIHT